VLERIKGLKAELESGELSGPPRKNQESG